MNRAWVKEPTIEIAERPPGKGYGQLDFIPAPLQPFVKGLVDSLPGAAMFLTRDLIIAYVNHDVTLYHRVVPEELPGMSAAELFGPAMMLEVEPILTRVLAGETICWDAWTRFEWAEVFGSFTATPFATDNGEVQGLVLLFVEKTATKLHEAALIERSNFHKAIVDTALDAVIMIDEQGLVTDYNPAAEATFGFTRAEAMGQSIGEMIVPQEHRAAHQAGMDAYMKTGIARVIGKRVELEALRKDGSRIPVELAITDVTVNNRRMFTAHLRDLTAARNAQAEIARQKEALYQKEKLAALGSLLSGVAHELNNPLSVVIGQTMMLREKISHETDFDRHRDDYVSRSLKVENAANRCAKIVKSFLAMARQRKAERSMVQVGDVVREARELLAYGLRSSGVSVTFDIPDDLPSLHLDGDQIHQVIVNLIVNSRQAMEEARTAQPSICVAARSLDNGTLLELTVRDNGPGIPDKIRNRIFDPFFTTKAQDIGTGIGLAVSRGLIESHGGTLSLSNPQPKVGAEFRIVLPILGAPDTEAEAEQAIAAVVPETTQQKRILVVDDEADIAELLCDIAENLGYVATAVHSGAAARDILAQDHDFVAILSDIRMPDGDGPSLYEWLQTHRPEMIHRIGFVTGDTLGPAAGRFLARSGSPVIEKPFSMGDIERILRDLTTLSK